MKIVFGILFTLLLILNASNVFAQKSVDSTSIIKPWEIGLNLLPLINKEKTAYNLLVKWNYKNGAIRLRPIFNAQYTPNQSGFTNFDSKRIEIGIFLGHEWRKRLSPKFFMIYGAELGYAKIKKQDAVLDDPNGTSFYTVVYSYLDNAYANIFLGPKFMVTKRISLSVETTLSAVWTKGKIDTDRFEVNPTHGPDKLLESGRLKYSPWNKNYNLIPIYAVNFSYQF